MYFCKKCGNQLEKGQVFCTKCGTEKAAATVKLEKPTRAVVKERARIPLKLVMIVVIGIVIAASLGGGHMYMMKQANPMKVIDKFDAAVQGKDAEALAEMINAGQSADQVSEEEAASFIEYLTDDKQYYLSLLEDLNFQSFYIEDGDPVTDPNGNKMFKLEQKNEKKWFLYKQYEIIFYPMELRITSNLEAAEIWLNGEKLEKKTERDSYILAGYLFPGKHVIKAEAASDYSDFQLEETIDFSGAANNQVEAMLEFDSTMVKLDANFDDAILFVNGKSTGKSIRELGTIGPLASDGSVTLHVERTHKGETVKSDQVQVFEDKRVRFSLEEPIVITEAEMARFMDSYFSTMVASINAREVSIARSVMDLEGKAYPEHRDYLKVLEERGITEEYLSMELLSFEEVEGGYKVKTNEAYHIFYSEETGKYKSFESEFFVTLLKEGLRIHTLISTKELASRDL
jgi:membrane-associated protein TcaA